MLVFSIISNDKQQIKEPSDLSNVGWGVDPWLNLYPVSLSQEIE